MHKCLHAFITVLGSLVLNEDESEVLVWLVVSVLSSGYLEPSVLLFQWRSRGFFRQECSGNSVWHGDERYQSAQAGERHSLGTSPCEEASTSVSHPHSLLSGESLLLARATAETPSVKYLHPLKGLQRVSANIN